MVRAGRTKRYFRRGLGLVLIGAAAFVFACSQEGAPPSDLSKKAPPNLGAIADVDGSDDTKKEGDKAPAGAGQKPAGTPAAPKQ